MINVNIGKLRKFKKKHFSNEINYRFHFENEDIYLYSRAGDNKPANIDTVPHNFSIIGSDTEIYIPDRGRK